MCLPAHLLGLLSACGLTLGLPALLQGYSASITVVHRCLSSALFSHSHHPESCIPLGILMPLTQPTVPSIVMPDAEIAQDPGPTLSKKQVTSLPTLNSDAYRPGPILGLEPLLIVNL